MLPTLDIELDATFPGARVQIAIIDHLEADSNLFLREGVFWTDLCVTPRRPSASARFAEHWAPYRHVALGSLVTFPPGQPLQIKSAGGRHASLICQFEAETVHRQLPRDFQWTEHRREACLNVACGRLNTTLMRLYHELRSPGIGSDELCRALISQASIELARFLISVGDPDENGGLAAWRRRIIDERVSVSGPLPTVSELAELCKISPRQLRRAFRTSHGCSVTEFLAQRRIETAKRRLYSRASLRDVAASLGYASQSSFTDAFHRATGTTPGEFRKRVIASRGSGRATPAELIAGPPSQT